MKTPPPGQVRIIAGQLRGSKLPVADRPGLRPTSDRVRETLFNWLQTMLPGARVLDLFAGTGALGFEAASRGAAEVVLVERDPALADSLRAQAQRLKVDALRVHTADALAWLRNEPARPFDLVFLDPPFDAGLGTPAAAALAPWLAPSAWIYVESAVAAMPELPADWQPHRSGKTRDVAYGLFRTG
jgi:16S rRNA (guanine966-N2)-methyltransferase